MKISLAISVQKTKFSVLVFKGNLEKNVAKIASLGYNGIELAIKNPRMVDVKAIEGLLGRYKLELSAIGTGQAFSEEGLSFTHPEKSIRDKAIEKIIEQIDLARNFNAVVILGCIRGKISEKASKKKAINWARDAFNECARFAEKLKVVLALEPINRYETNIVNNVAGALEFVDTLGYKIPLLLDTFHMNIEEPSIYKSIIMAKDKIAHIHMADSNRWPPGYGHMSFEEIIEALREIDYQGYISLEMLPLPDADRAAQHGIEYLRKILDNQESRVNL